MKHSDRYYLIARAVRGELTEAERQELDRLLAEDGTLREDWRLERALHELPEPPVSTNFTSLVLQAVLKGERGADGRKSAPKIRWAWIRLAAGFAAVAVIGIATLRYEHASERRELATTVNAFTEAASVVGFDQVPPTEILADFDAIQRLSLPAESELDLELLAALEK